MAKRKLTDKLIKKDQIKEEMRFIKGSVNAYITPTGKIYIDYGNNLFLLKKQFLSNGYLYCGILYKGKKHLTSKRVHRLVALTYLPNNDPKKVVVGHKNNIKTDNRVENLYWTTVQENTQKAYEDNLMNNKKSWEDNQSIPVCQFDIEGTLIDTFGSIGEASRKTKMTKTGILHQCLHRCTTRPRKGYYYRFKFEYDECGFVL